MKNILILFAIIFGSCADMIKTKNLYITDSIPEAWQHPITEASEFTGKWWEAFQDTVLDRVFTEFNANSPDLKSIASRLEMARQVYKINIAPRLPAASLEEAITKSQLPLSEFTPDDGESFSQLRERAINFLTTLETHNQGQVIMVCTHGDLLRVLVGSILEKDLESSMIIQFDNTSYTTIVLNNNGKWIVESIHQVP